MVSYLDRIPIFACEGVLGSLFEPFLTLGKALVPTYDGCQHGPFLRGLVPLDYEEKTHFPTAMIADWDEL